MEPIHPRSTSTGTIYQFEWRVADALDNTHPRLVEFIVLIPEDQVVRSEMEGADVRAAQAGTDDPLDLFQYDRWNENSQDSQNH
jgi:hypothetical protein